MRPHGKEVPKASYLGIYSDLHRLRIRNEYAYGRDRPWILSDVMKKANRALE